MHYFVVFFFEKVEHIAEYKTIDVGNTFRDGFYFAEIVVVVVFVSLPFLRVANNSSLLVKTQLEQSTKRDRDT